jgi:hypothetical protein
VRIGSVAFGFLNAALNLAHCIQVLADLGTVGRTELPLQAGNVFSYPIEQTRALPEFGLTVGSSSSVAEQALKNDTRVSLGR